jgi:hypothetical protein
MAEIPSLGPACRYVCVIRATGQPVLVSYYERNAIPLVGVKVLLVLWGAVRIRNSRCIPPRLCGMIMGSGISFGTREPLPRPAMALNENVLCEATFKDRGMSVETRIYRTLTAIESARGRRTARAVAQLLELLHRKRFLNDQQLDEFLYSCVMASHSTE